MVQESLRYDFALGRYKTEAKTVFHIDIPEKWDYYSIQHFIGTILGKYFLVIIGLLMVIVGFRIALRNKWSGFNKLIGRHIGILSQKQILPEQQLALADGSSIYIYSELDESASKTHKQLKFEELGSEAAKLPIEELQIFNYYILKVNNDGVIVRCRKFMFEGPFADAADIENWDEFLNQ
jgi:hypothetical protein